MGSPRTDFRPDKQVETNQTHEMYSSAQRGVAKHEHNRRQRQHNRKLITAIDDDEHFLD